MTAYDTAAWLGAAAPPIVHVPHGTELGPAPTAASTAARRGPLLALGDDRPRKNRDCVRAAHALARRHCMDLPELRFVGPPHDYVTEAEKRRLLLTCRALVQCSRFEGFGLPVLEGMAHGAPVLCSALPPHLETTGGAAYLVDPRDERSIADGMVALHRDDERRWQLAQAGHARAAMYSCTAVAEAWRRLHRGELP